jgi:hypothetical protein
MIKNKLSKVSDSYNINRYDNGFMVEISGRNSENDYKTAKVLCNTEEDLLAVIKQINALELDD